MREGYVGAFAASIDTVFLAAVPFAAVAFALSWFLREVPQRKTARTSGLGESYAMLKADDSLREIERALTVLASREGQRSLYRRLATRANVDLAPPECWLLLRLGEHEDLTPGELTAGSGCPNCG